MQLEALLEETAALTRENHKILKSMQRMDLISFWVKIALWALVIVLPLLFIGPILEALLPVAGNAPGAVFGVPSPEQLIETYQQLQEQAQGLQ